MIEYKWDINRMKTITDPTLEIENYVLQVFYCLNGTNTETGRVESVCGDRVLSSDLPATKPENFISFEDLTQETVEGWLVSSFDEATVSSFMADIEKRLRVEEHNVSPPWIKNDPVVHVEEAMPSENLE